MQIMGDGTDGRAPIMQAAPGAPQGIGSVFGDIGQAFQNLGPQMARDQAMQLAAQTAADRQAAQQGMGQLYASSMNPDTPGVDPAMGQAILAHGGSLSDVFALNRAFATTHGGVDSPLNARIATATNNFDTTPMYQGRSNDAAMAREKQSEGAAMERQKLSEAATAQRAQAARDATGPNTQNYVVPGPDGQPIIGQTADGGKTDFRTGQPLPTGAALAGAASIPGAAAAPDVKNYVVPGPNGTVASGGRTLDGKTDMATGQPLPPNAMLAGSAAANPQVSAAAQPDAKNYVVPGPNGTIGATGRTFDGLTDAVTKQPLPGNAMIAGSASANPSAAAQPDAKNYFVPGPDGAPVSRGRTLDGKTDMTTNQPLPSNATIASAAPFVTPTTPDAKNYQYPGPDGKPVLGRTLDGKTDMTTNQPLPPNAVLSGAAPVSGGVTMNPEAIALVAQRIVLHDPAAIPAARSLGKENLTAILDKVAEIGGPDAASAANAMIGNAMDYAHSHAEATAMGGLGAKMANFATEAKSMGDQALAASALVPRANFVPLAQIEQMGQEAMNDPNLSAFVAANNSYVNAYSKAINPSGVPTIDAQTHAYKVLNTAKNPAAYAAAVNQLQREVGAAAAAPEATWQAMKNSWAKEQGGAGAAPSAPAAGAPATERARPPLGTIRGDFILKAYPETDKNNWTKWR